jgi:hypothetical protein
VLRTLNTHLKLENSGLHKRVAELEARTAPEAVTAPEAPTAPLAPATEEAPATAPEAPVIDASSVITGRPWSPKGEPTDPKMMKIIEEAAANVIKEAAAAEAPPTAPATDEAPATAPTDEAPTTDEAPRRSRQRSKAKA